MQGNPELAIPDGTLAAPSAAFRKNELKAYVCTRNYTLNLISAPVKLLSQDEDTSC
jgi:hypothetical protein